MSEARKKNTVKNGARASFASAGRPDDRTKHVPFACVYVPEHLLCTDPSTRIAGLARAIQRDEQLVPVLVELGGPPGFLFTLAERSARVAAYEQLGWTDREILVRVAKQPRDPAARVALSWAASMQRESPLSLLDRAWHVHALSTGAYFAGPGEEAHAHDVDQVMKLLDVTRSCVQRLLRVHRRLHPDVVHAVRRARENGLFVPASLLLTMTDLTRDDDSDDVRLGRQTKIFTEWTDKKLATKAAREVAGR